MTEAASLRGRSRGILAALMACVLFFGSFVSTASAVSVKTVQARLAAKGYLAAQYVTGAKNAHTTQSLRIFKLMNGMTATTSLTRSAYKRLMSRKAVARKTVICENASDTVYSAFKKKKTAVIVDMASGARVRIRRVGGTNHLDVEPAALSDTKKLKKLYKGYSWDSRGVVLIVGGRYYIGAINFYPHGSQINKRNGFKGHFCLHLYGSKTHGTETTNAAHQSNIRKLKEYFAVY